MYKKTRLLFFFVILFKRAREKKGRSQGNEMALVTKIKKRRISAWPEHHHHHHRQRKGFECNTHKSQCKYRIYKKKQDDH